MILFVNEINMLYIICFIGDSMRFFIILVVVFVVVRVGLYGGGYGYGGGGWLYGGFNVY